MGHVQTCCLYVNGRRLCRYSFEVSTPARRASVCGACERRVSSCVPSAPSPCLPPSVQCEVLPADLIDELVVAHYDRELFESLFGGGDKKEQLCEDEGEEKTREGGGKDDQEDEDAEKKPKKNKRRLERESEDGAKETKDEKAEKKGSGSDQEQEEADESVVLVTHFFSTKTSMLLPLSTMDLPSFSRVRSPSSFISFSLVFSSKGFPFSCMRLLHSLIAKSSFPLLPYPSKWLGLHMHRHVCLHLRTRVGMCFSWYLWSCFFFLDGIHLLPSSPLCSFGIHGSFLFFSSTKR